MKRLVLGAVFLALSGGQAVPAQPPSYQEWIESTKKNIVIDQAYEVGTTATFSIGPNESARLKFAENEAGIKEILFYFDADSGLRGELI